MAIEIRCGHPDLVINEDFMLTSRQTGVTYIAKISTCIDCMENTEDQLLDQIKIEDSIFRVPDRYLKDLNKAWNKDAEPFDDNGGRISDEHWALEFAVKK